MGGTQPVLRSRGGLLLELLGHLASALELLLLLACRRGHLHLQVAPGPDLERPDAQPRDQLQVAFPAQRVSAAGRVVAALCHRLPAWPSTLAGAVHARAAPLRVVQVQQQALPLAQHLVQAARGGVVLPVLLQVRRELRYPGREGRDLRRSAAVSGWLATRTGGFAGVRQTWTSEEPLSRS